jgi:hypothetical protein
MNQSNVLNIGSFENLNKPLSPSVSANENVDSKAKSSNKNDTSSKSLTENASSQNKDEVSNVKK